MAIISKWRVAWALALGLLVGFAGSARAQNNAQAVDSVLRDINRILANGPVYLSSRLPIMAVGGDLAAGKPLGKFPDWSIALNLHSGLTAGFRDIAYGMATLQDFQTMLPNLVPLPTISIVGRIGTIEDVEVALKIFFIPRVKIELPSEMDVATGMLDVGAQVRWRFFKSRGKAIPELVALFSVNYFTGAIEVGVNSKQPFSAANGLVTGQLDMRGAPILGWDIGVISPELRVAWNVAWFHPYFGLGFDFTFGEVDGGLDATMRFTINQTPINEGVAMNTTNTMEIPRIFGFRPAFGMEFDCGRIFRIVLEANLELTAHQRPNPKLAQEIKDDMNVDAVETARGGQPDGGYLYNKANAKKGGIDPLNYAFGLGLRLDFE